MRTEKLEDIVNKDDKDLMTMVEYIKRNNRKGFNNSKKFKVFTLETSRGKTSGSTYGMCLSILAGNKTKFVFTTKKKDECENIAKNIINEFDGENSYNGETVVMIYNPELKKDEATEYSSSNFLDCCNAKILIITHATYLNMCKSKSQKHEDYRDLVKEKFNTLIVDEEINAVSDSQSNFDKYIYENNLKILKFINKKEILLGYQWLCDCLMSVLEAYNNNDSYNNKIVIAERNNVDIFSQEMYDELIGLIKEVDSEVIEDYNTENDTNITKAKIIGNIEKIFLLYNNLDKDQVLYYNNKLFTCDFDFEFLMLDKNVYLDASANFNSLYQSKLFDVVKSKRVIDHKKCYLMWHKRKANSSAKNKNLTEWRNFIVEDIRKNTLKDSEILILSKKAECKALEERFINDDFKEHCKSYALLNFFNMRGINDYGKFNECFIIHEPRFPYPMYVLTYMYYVADKDFNIYELDMELCNRGNNTQGFRNKVLDGLLFDDEISNLYQACKRICRNRDPKGNFHIYNANVDVIKALEKELLNVKPIPSDDNEKSKLADDFYMIISQIRDGLYEDYKVIDGRTKKKVKAIKKKGAKYLEVNKKLFYELLNIDSKHFKRDIIDNIDEKGLKIKFENEVVIITKN